LSWREERDLRRAMYDSLRRVRQEQQRRRQPSAALRRSETGIHSQRKLRSFCNSQGVNSNSSAKMAVTGEKPVSPLQPPKSPTPQAPSFTLVKDTKRFEGTPSFKSTNVLRNKCPIPRLPSRLHPTSSSSRLIQLSKKLKAKAARRTASVGVSTLSHRVRLHSSAQKRDALETTLRLDDSPRANQPPHSLPSDTIPRALWQDSEGNPVDTHDFVDFL
uniref:Si:ch73-389k6.1 n=1 Tax=Schistocephalus solidus TaxID=70667 RepID=A0A183THF5_SCHSO